VPDSVPADSAQAKILRLLRVLHALNADARSTSLVPASLVGEAAFVNNKLTAKLGRQLEEPMILARYVTLASVFRAV
jgi:E3 ubiquitin-protein ligase TRIP12